MASLDKDERAGFLDETERRARFERERCASLGQVPQRCASLGQVALSRSR